MDVSRHRGRVAIVTGAASGIGRATAIRLAAEGAAVVALDVNVRRLAETCQLVRDAGGEISSVRANLMLRDGVDKAVADTLGAHGHIDALLNIAGVMDGFAAPHELTDATWRHVLGVNLDGPMMLCRAVLPHMRERRSGVIVNVASIAGLGGGGAGLAYTVSKHAVVGLTRNIAWMYRHEGIRCNAVCPGGVATNIGESMRVISDFGREQAAAYIGVAVRQAAPDELAATISWLVSDEASNVNGAILPVDGGWTAA